MKIAAIVGSNREDSYNKKVATFIQDRYRDSMDIELINIRDFPLYNQDEEEVPPETVQSAVEQIQNSDGLLFVTPEYNHSIPAVLKNAIDWFSRSGRPTAGKPTMIAGASQGALGTVRSQLHLRQILNAPGVSAKVLPQNEIFLGTIQDKFDNNGNLTDRATIDFIDNVVTNFKEWINQVS
ncbi:NADPH-dependent FMN reductase [Pontibacillus yanchengensis]|uniref:NADPH-dependent FMN reductase n=1 Tax=Pontibacillus yanchengensis Y32 TaxID=1385514 RepID=A0A0A2TBE7_9BACI|nr:NAD(P)H-dependent oxidoreductase [Pontibacillus yanchengensis]KGP71753.1 NADPH-dependent FMN reductase [Pontibacillus yanchengensis Y32]